MEKKSRSREFWYELVERYEADPTQTHKDFSHDNDVPLSTFKSRLYAFRKEKLQADAPDNNDVLDKSDASSFIDVTPALSSPPPKSSQATLFLPNQISLEFTTLPDPHYLASFMAALRGY